MAGMRDANNTGRLRVRQDKGCPRQRQAANHGQHRFHVSNIIPRFTRSSTTFGFFSSIFGVPHYRTHFMILFRVFRAFFPGRNFTSGFLYLLMPYQSKLRIKFSAFGPKKSVRTLFLFHTFGRRAGLRGGTAKGGAATTLFADVLYRCICALTDTDNRNRAATAGAEMFFTRSHQFDVAFLGGGGLNYNRFAFGAGHRDGIARLEVFRLARSRDVVEHHQMLAAFHRLHRLRLILSVGGQPCG